MRSVRECLILSHTRRASTIAFKFNWQKHQVGKRLLLAPILVITLFWFIQMFQAIISVQLLTKNISLFRSLPKMAVLYFCLFFKVRHQKIAKHTNKVITGQWQRNDFIFAYSFNSLLHSHFISNMAWFHVHQIKRDDWWMMIIPIHHNRRFSHSRNFISKICGNICTILWVVQRSYNVEWFCSFFLHWITCDCS